MVVRNIKGILVFWDTVCIHTPDNAKSINAPDFVLANKMVCPWHIVNACNTDTDEDLLYLMWFIFSTTVCVIECQQIPHTLTEQWKKPILLLLPPRLVPKSLSKIVRVTSSCSSYLALWKLSLHGCHYLSHLPTLSSSSAEVKKKKIIIAMITTGGI